MSKTVEEVLADMYPEQHPLFEIQQIQLRSEERIPEILALIQDAWMLNPDARFFQLLWNVFQTDESLATLHNTEDWQVQQTLSEFLDNR